MEFLSIGVKWHLSLGGTGGRDNSTPGRAVRKAYRGIRYLRSKASALAELSILTLFYQFHGIPRAYAGRSLWATKDSRN